MPAAAATYAGPAGMAEVVVDPPPRPLPRLAARRAAELAGQPLEAIRIVSCHLGSGSSLTAIQAGRSVDTTMGFTPLEGLVMGTRAGTIDPGLVLWLIRNSGSTPTLSTRASRSTRASSPSPAPPICGR